MKTFQEYLQIINESNKDNAAISDTVTKNVTVDSVDVKNIKKIKDKVLFKRILFNVFQWNKNKIRSKIK